MDWGGWRIETSLIFLLSTGLTALLVALVVQWGWHALRYRAPFSHANRTLRRQRRGLDALNRAVLALAQGDNAAAERLAGDASRLLPPQPMTRLISAQAAQARGDQAAARGQFEALLEHPEGRILGLRGLIASALSEGRMSEALRLVGEAREIDARAPWAAETHFALLTRLRDWQPAEAALLALERSRAIPAEQIKTYRRTLIFLQARERAMAGDEAAASKLLARSLRIDPGFAPAADMGARIQAKAGRKAAAIRRLAKAWSHQPNPLLVDTFRALAPDESPGELLRRLEKLMGGNPAHKESRLLRAQVEVEAGHIEAAEELLEALITEGGDGRAYNGMIALERLRGAADASMRIRVLEEEALDAGAAPAWTCTSCGRREPVWREACGTCHAFASFVWDAEDRRGGEAMRPPKAVLSILPGPDDIRAAEADGLSPAPDSRTTGTRD